MVRDLEGIVEIKQAIFGDTGETNFSPEDENSLWESHFFHNSQRMKFFWYDLLVGFKEFYLGVFLA